ncbi:MAG TPA: SDR family NAD(P)-dependent oxidoreductase [Chitinophagaceae bacterium]|nr:SDR family NAD(P)-dependent oxidoreductase [Chitinophagaceae bacterium]
MYGIDKPYTLITGASEGLGKALAIECASRGMNLILVALPGIELYQLAFYIRKKYKVLVCEFELDLSKDESCLYLWNSIQQNNIPVNMLINNAGLGSTTGFGESGFETFRKQIELNVMATSRLTHLFLPELKQHQQSYILNVSSLCVFFYLQKKQVYGATKSFIYFFSKSLRKEVKKYGTQVSVLCPGGLISNPAQYLLNRSASWIGRSAAMNPEDVAPIAIDGLLRGKERIIPGKWNRFSLLLNKLLPDWLKNRIASRQMPKLNPQQAAMLLKGTSSESKREAA